MILDTYFVLCVHIMSNTTDINGRSRVEATLYFVCWRCLLLRLPLVI